MKKRGRTKGAEEEKAEQKGPNEGRPNIGV